MSTAIPVPTPPEQISDDEWWSIDAGNGEVSLHQYGWNVTTIGGSRYDMPTKRGDNRVYPYRPGARHNNNKMAEERAVHLQMWVQATHPGTGQFDGEMKTRFNDSWNFIRTLVWSWSGNQMTLIRRWWQTIQGVRVLHKASALVEVTDAMPPTMQGRYHATFEMVLRMASPFFYGDWITETIQPEETKTIWNPGQDRAMYENLEITFTGPLWKPTLSNFTPTPNVTLKYNNRVTGGFVTCTVPDFLCFSAAHENVIRYISHSGARFWWGLVPGNNLVSLHQQSDNPGLGSGGYATVRYRPAFL